MKKPGKTFGRLMQALRDVKAHREGGLDLPTTRVTAHVPNKETMDALKEAGKARHHKNTEELFESWKDPGDKD